MDNRTIYDRTCQGAESGRAQLGAGQNSATLNFADDNGSGAAALVVGGKIDDSRDAFFSGIVSQIGTQLGSTDPINLLDNDMGNSWRTTEVIPGGRSMIVPDLSGGRSVTRTFGPMTVYPNRFSQPVVSQQSYTDTYSDGRGGVVIGQLLTSGIVSSAGAVKLLLPR